MKKLLFISAFALAAIVGCDKDDDVQLVNGIFLNDSQKCELNSCCVTGGCINPSSGTTYSFYLNSENYPYDEEFQALDDNGNVLDFGELTPEVTLTSHSLGTKIDDFGKSLTTIEISESSKIECMKLSFENGVYNGNNDLVKKVDVSKFEYHYDSISIDMKIYLSNNDVITINYSGVPLGGWI